MQWMWEEDEGCLLLSKQQVMLLQLEVYILTQIQKGWMDMAVEETRSSLSKFFVSQCLAQGVRVVET